MTNSEKEIIINVVDEIKNILKNSQYEKSETSCYKIKFIINKYINLDDASKEFRDFFYLLDNCMNVYSCSGMYRKRLTRVGEAIYFIEKELLNNG